MRTIGLLSLLLAAPLLAQTTQPAKKAPSAAEYSISEVHLQTLPELNFLSSSAKTSFNELFPAIQKLMETLDKDMAKGNVRQGGPVMFVYHDVAEDMTKPFTLEVGMVLMEPAKDTGTLKFRKTPAFKCATIVFVGPVAKIGSAYEALMVGMKEKGLQPNGQMREMYLYFEKPESPNNVVQLQMGYK